MRFDQRVGRRVGDEVLRQFERDVMRGVRILGEQVEHLFAVLDSAGVNFFAQHALGIRIVQAIVEVELRNSLAGP